MHNLYCGQHLKIPMPKACQHLKVPMPKACHAQDRCRAGSLIQAIAMSVQGALPGGVPVPFDLWPAELPKALQNG